MSDVTSFDRDAANPAGDVDPTGDLSAPVSPMSAGALLKAARQAAGVHLAVLSSQLKVPVRRLEALEADHYPASHSPVFSRALALSVCRHLNIDAAPILSLMPASFNYPESREQVRTVNTEPVVWGQTGRTLWGVPAKVWVISVSMVVLIAALIGLPPPSQWTWVQAQNTLQASPELGGSKMAPEPIVSVPVQTDTAIAPAPLLTASELAKTPAESSAVPSHELAFNAVATSWVEVRESTQLVWSGYLNAGDAKTFPVSRPVSVVVGRADAVELSFKGQPVDLKPHTKMSVVRIEFKP